MDPSRTVIGEFLHAIKHRIMYTRLQEQFTRSKYPVLPPSTSHCPILTIVLRIPTLFSHLLSSHGIIKSTPLAEAPEPLLLSPGPIEESHLANSIR